MTQLQDRDGWGFLDHITDDYGHVVRLTGMLGVSASCVKSTGGAYLRCLQRRVLWVFDPKAMHHILVKVGTLAPCKNFN